MTAPKCLIEAIDTSRQMLSRLEEVDANSADLDSQESLLEQLDTLEKTREQQLRSIFQTVSTESLTAYQELLQELRSLDQRLLETAGQKQSELRQLVLKFKKSKKATAAYQANDRRL